MVSSFHPHSMCKKVERLTAKLDALRVQNRQSPSKYQGFIRKLVCYKAIAFLLKLFEPPCFSMFKMHHSKPNHQFTTLSDFICYVSCIYWLFWAIRPSNWKAFEMNSKKVESWHGFIIWPTYHVQESRECYGKNWMHFVYKTDNLFRSIRVS